MVSVRNLPFQCESKNGDGITIVSSTESESQGSERFLFLAIPLLIPYLAIKCELTNNNNNSNNLFTNSDDIKGSSRK